jgi:hypothetical protein
VSLERRVKKLEESNPTDEASMAARGTARCAEWERNCALAWE